MLESMLIQYGIPILISVLKRLGLIDAAEALAAKDASEVIAALKTATVQYVYPTGKNGQES